MRRPLPLVLMYHGLGTVPAAEDPANLFVPVAAFAGQLRRLHERGYRVIDEATFVAAVDGAPAPPRSVLLTFDDGYRSVLEHAAPLLSRRGLPSICFVSPGLAGTPPAAGDHESQRLVDATEIRALAGAGVTIGCHGWAHESMPGMAPTVLECSTRTARDWLARELGAPPRSFAYPFGHHDEAAREGVLRAGFDLAFATYDGAGRHALPRVDVNATDTPRSFDLKITRGYRTTRRATSAAPGIRRAVHSLVGRAERT